MGTKTPRQRWEELPDDRPAELIGEEIVYWSPGTPGHSFAIGRLLRKLGDPFESGEDGPGGWWVLVEPEVEFPPLVLIPDLAAWRRERFTPRAQQKPITTGPDWVCEVLSPSTVARDRTIKLATYAQSGVEHAWLIDPDARTLEAYRLDAGRWIVDAVHAGDATVRVEPFAAIELPLAALWVQP